MSKIICDICGTTYPDTAECCPICGCSRDSAMDLLGDALEIEEDLEDTRIRKGRFSSKKKREIFDYDEVNPRDNTDEALEEVATDEDSYYEEEDRPRSNTFAVVCLTALIAILLLAAGFLFVRFILPNMGSKAPVPAPVVQETAAPAAVETTGYRVPCTSMTLSSGTLAELTEQGNYFLIHATVMPEDTTDEITYISGDENIATVSADGRITAVSEGETVIYITCGSLQQTCKVVCSFVEDTLPPTEETVPETEETVPETTVETEPPFRTDVTLKLVKTDIRLGVYYEYRLELDCDLKPEEVEWSVEHPHIASVDETGLVTALKSGTTDVIVKYGDQEVRCKVRCE